MDKNLKISLHIFLEWGFSCTNRTVFLKKQNHNIYILFYWFIYLNTASWNILKVKRWHYFCNTLFYLASKKSSVCILQVERSHFLWEWVYMFIFLVLDTFTMIRHAAFLVLCIFSLSEVSWKTMFNMYDRYGHP